MIKKWILIWKLANHIYAGHDGNFKYICSHFGAKSKLYYQQQQQKTNPWYVFD